MKLLLYLCWVCFFVTSLVKFSYAETKLLLTTEDYPPFNYLNQETGQISGLSADVVAEIMARAGITYSTDHLPWKRAYHMALNEEGTCVFSASVTPERASLFKWVGPLAENNWVLIADGISNIQIASLDEARDYRVGGYDGDAASLYLESMGFALNNPVRDAVNPALLRLGRIDLWVTGHLSGPYYASREGFEGFQIVHSFKKVQMSLACNKSVPTPVIEEMNSILRQMKQDGTYAKLQNKYGVVAMIPPLN